MGGKISKHPHLNGAMVWEKYDRISGRIDMPNLLKFDTDYNWLMDVYYKILSIEKEDKELNIHKFDISKDNVSLSFIHYSEKTIRTMTHKTSEYKSIIDCLYSIIYEFVNWYSEIDKKQQLEKSLQKDKRRKEHMKKAK